jgi:hypothetical protein
VDDVGQAADDLEIRFPESPSSTTMPLARKVILTGEKSSSKRITTFPRIRRATFGRRLTPRSISPNRLGAMPRSASRPRTTSGLPSSPGFSAAALPRTARRGLAVAVRFPCRFATRGSYGAVPFVADRPMPRSKRRDQ